MSHSATDPGGRCCEHGIRWAFRCYECSPIEADEPTESPLAASRSDSPSEVVTDASASEGFLGAGDDR